MSSNFYCQSWSEMWLHQGVHWNVTKLLLLTNECRIARVWRYGQSKQSYRNRKSHVPTRKEVLMEHCYFCIFARNVTPHTTPLRSLMFNNTSCVHKQINVALCKEQRVFALMDSKQSPKKRLKLTIDWAVESSITHHYQNDQEIV